MQFKPCRLQRVVVNLIQVRGQILPPLTHLNHSISSKWLRVWSYCFVTFLSRYFPFRKFQSHHFALMYVAIAAIQLFSLILNTRISNVFEVFPPERNFLWDNHLFFGHHKTLRSFIIVIIRTITMETFQKIVLPKYGHRH